MKDIVKAIFLLAVMYILLFFLVKTNRESQVIQEKPEPVIITDTLTQVVYDTVFIDHFETVKLPVVDTTICYITDTVTRVDSIEVEVPISIYKLDTIFSTDTTSLNIRIQNSGYDIKFDSLSYKFEYTPTLNKTNFFKEHLKFGVGVSSGYGVFSKKPDVFVGVGFYYCF